MAYILIVDDDDDFANTIATVLNSAGHETNIETNTENVLSKLDEKQPDLLILDVMFPEDNSAGFKLAREIRLKDEKYENIPVVMLTAVNSEYPFGFSKKDIDDDWLPVSEFIEKPVDLDVLKQKVEDLLNKKS